MSNKLSAVLLLCISTVCLSSCDLLRVAGPCYGVGCPAGTAGGSGQYKPGEAPKAQNAAAPASAKPAAAPTPNASAQSNSVQPNATTQPAPAQEANAEAKPSPFHAIGEFFEHLSPHHNSGANSGASN